MSFCPTRTAWRVLITLAVLILAALIMAAMALCTPLPEEKPLTDWKKAHSWARQEDCHVRLSITVIETKEDKSFSVTLVDGDKKYEIAHVAFYGPKEVVYLLSLSSLLKEMDKPPSDKAKIVLKTKSGVDIKFSLKISLDFKAISNEPEEVDP